MNIVNSTNDAEEHADQLWLGWPLVPSVVHEPVFERLLPAELHLDVEEDLRRLGSRRRRKRPVALCLVGEKKSAHKASTVGFTSQSIVIKQVGGSSRTAQGA